MSLALFAEMQAMKKRIEQLEAQVAQLQKAEAPKPQTLALKSKVA